MSEKNLQFYVIDEDHPNKGMLDCKLQLVVFQPSLTWLGLSGILGRAKAFKKGLARLGPAQAAA